MTRSPVMGFNHNIRHLGWLFHVQTEDSGTRAPHIITHLFQRGVILATKKSTYDPDAAPDGVRSMMQGQHKTVLRELKDGRHDERIRQFLGDAPDMGDGDPSLRDAGPSAPPTPTPLPAADLLVASWPQTADLGAASDWEWREELGENPAWMTAWNQGPASPQRPGARKDTLRNLAAVAPGPAPMRHVHRHFHSRAALLDGLFPNGRLGGIVVELDRAAANEPVSLVVSVDAEVTMEFKLVGSVAWVSADGRTAGVAFPASEHMAVRRMVLLVRGARAARKKAGPHPLSGTGYVVLWLPGGKRYECSADTNEHGLFVPESLQVTAGQTIPVLLRGIENLATQRVETVVEFVENDSDGGVGLRFLFPTADDQENIVRWVDALLRQ